jgi:hypothetical protein
VARTAWSVSRSTSAVVSVCRACWTGSVVRAAARWICGPGRPRAGPGRRLMPASIRSRSCFRVPPGNTSWPAGGRRCVAGRRRRSIARPMGNANVPTPQRPANAATWHASHIGTDPRGRGDHHGGAHRHHLSDRDDQQLDPGLDVDALSTLQQRFTPVGLLGSHPTPARAPLPVTLTATVLKPRDRCGHTPHRRLAGRCRWRVDLRRLRAAATKRARLSDDARWRSAGSSKSGDLGQRMLVALRGPSTGRVCRRRALPPRSTASFA